MAGSHVRLAGRPALGHWAVLGDTFQAAKDIVAGETLGLSAERAPPALFYLSNMGLLYGVLPLRGGILSKLLGEEDASISAWLCRLVRAVTGSCQHRTSGTCRNGAASV